MMLGSRREILFVNGQLAGETQPRQTQLYTSTVGMQYYHLILTGCQVFIV